jgi:replicative DNA helicase
MRLWPEEAERNVLGAILCAASWPPDAGHKVTRHIQATGLDLEHFWLASHGVLYRTIVRMVNDSQPVDAVSVAAELDRGELSRTAIRDLSHGIGEATTSVPLPSSSLQTVSRCERWTQEDGPRPSTPFPAT